MKIKSLVLSVSILLALATSSHAQASTSAPQDSAIVPNKSPSEPFTSDTPDILRETQLAIRHPGYAGLVWWIPFEFWKKSAMDRGVSADKVEQTFGKLRDYTVISVFGAKVSSLAAFDFFSPEDIQKNVVLRDSAGKEYSYIKDPSQDAQNLAAMIKPILSAAMGKAGESMQILFFPGKTQEGALIADATRKGEFSIVFKNLLGEPESVFLWRLPLTSVSAPKYCPVGKERVNLNWEYCPWHGVRLNGGSKQ